MGKTLGKRVSPMGKNVGNSGPHGENPGETHGENPGELSHGFPHGENPTFGISPLGKTLGKTLGM